MGLAGGPNITEDGLVFAYDTGNITRSYKGKPTTNILTAMSYAYGEQNGALFKTHYGLEDVYIPAIGKTTAHFCEVYNDYNGGSGNCCPSLFGYGGDIRPGVVGGTTYTYQIIYRTTTGYAHPNYMYHYQYSDSGYITEYGLWNASREEDLGGGWKHAWGTFTLSAATTRLYCYLFHYEYATFNKVQVAGVMLTQGSTIIPPRQFITHSSTRSATEGLLDIAGNTTIDLSNVSFDSNGQITFDGTNDYINIPSSNVFDTQTVTVEVVVKPYATYQFGFWFEKGIVNTQYSLFIEGNNIVWRQADQSQYSPSSNLTANGWNHVVGTFKTGERITYVNGIVRVQDSLVYTMNTNQGNQFIGSYNSGGYHYSGEIAIVRVYNRVLTAGEIEQNFQGIKNRFSI